jgi:HEAT repeat protein
LLAISNTSDKTLIKTICRILDSDLDQNVSGVAAEVLSIFCEMALNDKLTKRDNSLIKSKLKTLVKSCRFDNQNRLKALKSVSVFNDSAMDYYINFFYSSTDTSEKQASISSMGRTSNPKWLIYVRESLFDSSTSIRIEAINAFSELCDVEMADELTELIEDPELSVQLATIFALKKIGGRQSVTLLIKSLKSPEPEVVSASIDSLRFISHEDNIDLNLFNDSNELGKKKIPSEKEEDFFNGDWSTLTIKSSEEQNELDPFIDVSEVDDFWDRNN